MFLNVKNILKNNIYTYKIKNNTHFCNVNIAKK